MLFDNTPYLYNIIARNTSLLQYITLISVLRIDKVLVYLILLLQTNDLIEPFWSQIFSHTKFHFFRLHNIKRNAVQCGDQLKLLLTWRNEIRVLHVFLE